MLRRPQVRDRQPSDHDLVEVRAIQIGEAWEKGLFVRRAIPAGTALIEDTGSTVPLREVLAAAAGGFNVDNVLEVGVGQFMFLGLIEYANHSCEPNALFRGVARLVTLRDLAEGEEVRFDYSTTSSPLNLWEMKVHCRCGAAGCRGRIGNVWTVPRPILLRYYEQGMMQDYIRELIRDELLADPGSIGVRFRRTRRAAQRGLRRMVKPVYELLYGRGYK